jgi:glycosyltransferase involved in cell wall biosynthesis
MEHPRLAYVMTFPVLSETFILREILELVDRGVDIRILSIRTPREQVVHGDVERLRSKAVYCPYLLSFRLWLANLRMLFGRPRQYLAALADVISFNLAMPRELAKALLLFPKSVYFAAVVEREGVHHVHALYAGVHAVAAMVVSRLTGRPFSFAVRASDNLYRDNYRLPDKVARAAFVKAVTELYRQDLLASRRFWGRDVLRYCERFPEDKVVVVRSAIDLAKYRPRAREPDGRLCLSVGRLDGHKGFNHLLDAYKVLAARGVEFDAVVVGGGHERERLARQLAGLGLQARVKLAGPLPAERVKELYLAAKIVVVSSVWEGLPNVLMEALALGVPVVTTDVAGIPELVEDGVNGLVVRPKDPVALADGIARLLGDARLRARFAAAGRKAVAREFGLSHNASRILAQFHRHTPGYAPYPVEEPAAE